MLRSVCIAVALILGVLSISATAQDEKGIPKELLQYVKDAQRAGLKSAQIRQNAVKAGWPEPTVDEALASPETAEKPDPVKVVEGDPAKESDPATPPAAAPTVNPPATDGGAVKPAVPVAADPGNPAAAPEKKPESAEGAHDDDYLIGEGDVLQVAVWGEPTASVPAATVRTDGKISMPLIKDVKVAGLTPAQVEKYVQEQLGKIIRAPDVTVIVAQINSKKIYLTGAVKREGPLKFTYRMTVLQAISESGGLTDYAKRKEIYVLHTESGRQFKLPFNYNAVLKGEHMEQNIQLSPGDTIVVP
jgi:polysaccharide biosynthesis/export protein